MNDDPAQNLAGFNYAQDNPTLAPDGKPVSQYVSILPQGYQGSMAGGGGSGDWAQNLLQFGLATMAAGSKPGATTLGALGEGGLAATKSARDLQELQAKTGLQKAQMGLFNAENMKNRTALSLQLQQINFQRAITGQPPMTMADLMNGGSPQAAPPVLAGSSGGAQAASVAGGDTAPGTQIASAGPAPAPAGAPQQPPAERSIAGIPLSVWQGQAAPTKAQAAQMAGIYDAQGLSDKAKIYRDYAMKTPEGYQLRGDYGQAATAGGPQDPRVIKQDSAAKAEGEAPTTMKINSMKPRTLRGPGSVDIDPYTGVTRQIPNEIDTVDPNSGAHFKKFIPLGVNTTGPSGQAVQPPPGMSWGGSSNGAAAPAAAPAAGAEPSFQTQLPPGQKEIIEGAAKNYNEEGKKAYQSAVDLKGSMEYINRDIATMGEKGFAALGSGADSRVAFAKTINGMQNAVGMTPTFDPNKIAAWEDFTKESTLGGMKGLSAMFGGSREAASIVHTSIGAFPHPETSYQGARLLTSAFSEAANHEIDKRNFETNMLAKTGGNLTGVNEAFNQQYPPAMYTRRAISMVQPYKVSGDETQDQMMKRYLPGTQIQLPNGKIKVLPGPTSIQLEGAASGG